MRGSLAALMLILCVAAPARAQLRDRLNIDRLNRHLSGQVVDYTQNHGSDRRIPSTALGMPRDLYVYLPPGYDPARAYPVLLYLHMGSVDEHSFAGGRPVHELDRMIAHGEFPPTIVVAPDGTLAGENSFRATHSFFINGVRARFEDHIMGEVLPFVMSRYPIRPERSAHAVMGASAGGFGALNLAIKHRAFFGSVATLSAPANLRYTTTKGPRANFDPETYRWRTTYDPDEPIGIFYAGLSRIPARKYIEPIFGQNPDSVVAAISRENPAELITTTALQPGELGIYMNYAGCDNYNFDAQAESFAWLAAQRGICVTLDKAPLKTHTLPYFLTQHKYAFAWLGCRLDSSRSTPVIASMPGTR